MNEIVGRLVPCARCKTPIGVPIPENTTIVEGESRSDDSTVTQCPECDHRFDVFYLFDGEN